MPMAAPPSKQELYSVKYSDEMDELHSGDSSSLLGAFNRELACSSGPLHN
jgi:hypothetical protein